jgi:hypothetical protein
MFTHWRTGMRKRSWFIAVALAVAVSGGGALAATLSNGSGQSCGDFVGTWHFVNNQTGGAAPGTLTASFTSGTVSVAPASVNNKTQHFYVLATGTLLNASTDLPGRLLLSDFSCNDIKEPPPCDPKKEKCP